MTDFGRFRLSYEPPTPDPYSGVLDHSVEMTISGEADLTNLLDFFASFLRATGYVFDGKVKIVEEEVKKNPPPRDTVIYGGSGTDTISFGAAQPAMQFGFGTSQEVISFS